MLILSAEAICTERGIYAWRLHPTELGWLQPLKCKIHIFIFMIWYVPLRVSPRKIFSKCFAGTLSLKSNISLPNFSTAKSQILSIVQTKSFPFHVKLLSIFFPLRKLTDEFPVSGACDVMTDICMYVMYVCTYVCMYVCMYVCTWCMYVMYVCGWVCVCVCVCVREREREGERERESSSYSALPRGTWAARSSVSISVRVYIKGLKSPAYLLFFCVNSSHIARLEYLGHKYSWETALRPKSVCLTSNK
jgi:hypothetical protein